MLTFGGAYAVLRYKLGFLPVIAGCAHAGLALRLTDDWTRVLRDFFTRTAFLSV